MKRAADLYRLIPETANLELAFWQAARGKTLKPEVVSFRQNLAANLSAIRHEFLDGDVALGDYRYFVIRDPKERTICAASFRERVIHHAVINVCAPCFEKFQIYDSYACRPGKGVDAALRRSLELARQYDYFLKLDIHRYFDSIDHRILICRLNRLFKDPQLLNFLVKLVDTAQVSPGCGLPIGNLTSQYFANHYLAGLDHFAKEVLHVRGYLRYMDDILLGADTKIKLKDWLTAIAAFLRENLHLTLNPPLLNKTGYGIPFLGYVVHPSGLRLSLKAKRRFSVKAAAAVRAEDSGRFLPLLAFVNRADSYGFRKNLFYGKRTEWRQPRETRRQLEQRGAELPCCEPEQQQPRQQQRQPRLPGCLGPQLKYRRTDVP